MDGFVQWMEKHFMPKASVIAAQRHLVAIRDAVCRNDAINDFRGFGGIN